MAWTNRVKGLSTFIIAGRSSRGSNAGGGNDGRLMEVYRIYREIKQDCANMHLPVMQYRSSHPHQSRSQHTFYRQQRQELQLFVTKSMEGQRSGVADLANDHRGSCANVGEAWTFLAAKIGVNVSGYNGMVR